MINDTNELLPLGQLPMWYINNIYIKNGYRKPNTNINFIDTIFSIHNDTLNIWVSLITILEFLLSFILLYFDNLNKLNKTFLLVYSLCCFIAFCCRLNYYIYSPTNEEIYYILIKLYYTNSLIISFISLTLIIHCLFYEQKYTYIKYVYIILLFVMFILINPLFNNNNLYNIDKREYRSSIFTLYIYLLFIPLIHYGIINSFTTYHYIFITITSIGILFLYYIGLFIYKNNIPEKFCSIIFIANSNNLCNILLHGGCIILYLMMRYILFYLEK
jgi:hypothetical protein